MEDLFEKAKGDNVSRTGRGLQVTSYFCQDRETHADSGQQNVWPGSVMGRKEKARSNVSSLLNKKTSTSY